MYEIDVLEQQAVDAAIAIDWGTAIILNKKILKLDPANIGAQLRLGFIYLQTNDLEHAKKQYKSVLRLQPANSIAQENIEKIKVLEEAGDHVAIEKDLNFNPNLFLDVPGKTKTVALVNVGQKNILAQLTVGEEVYLKPKKHKIEVRTKTNEFLGYLPDDLSKRLELFLLGQSEYKAFIKEVSLSRVSIFIREEKRGKKVLRFTSFPKDTLGSLSKINQGGITSDDDHAEGEDDDFVGSDIERLAENLSHEEKEYLPYSSEEEDEENTEE